MENANRITVELSDINVSILKRIMEENDFDNFSDAVGYIVIEYADDHDMLELRPEFVDELKRTSRLKRKNIHVGDASNFEHVMKRLAQTQWRSPKVSRREKRAKVNF